MGGGEGHVEEIGGTREETGHLTLDAAFSDGSDQGVHRRAG